MNYWLAVGSPANWRLSFEKRNVWGLTTRQHHWWEKLNEGDAVIFYVTKPVSGVVGHGIIQTKFKQNKPTWPEEIEQGKILWPWGFEFTVEYCLPESDWEPRKITSDTLKLKAGISFQSVEPDFAAQLIAQVQPVQAAVTDTTSPSLHEEIQQRLIEIGKLQNVISEREYSFDIGKLDVVWRRVANSVPTYVFEVQVGGDVYHALAKLKHAYDLWNSHIFIVATAKDKEKAELLISGTFHEIAHRIKFIELDKIKELYRRKKDYFDFENELGISV
jgi:predicted RNA-binding protein